MNTEDTHDQYGVISTGIRLQNAREQLGFTQQAIAERLCLKVSTIRDIEENRTPADLSTAFLRGYIRSYAKLVHISEEELLLPMIEKQQPSIRTSQIVPIENFSLKKYQKKHNTWLMNFTWLVLFVVISLTSVWWWQHYKVHEEKKISTETMRSSLKPPTTDKNDPSVSTDNISTNINLAKEIKPTANSAHSTFFTEKTAEVTEFLMSTQETQNSGQNAIFPFLQALQQNNTKSQTSTNNATIRETLTTKNDILTSTADLNSLIMNFTDDCWLEITDKDGKKLFSGLQHKDNNLNLNGQLLYKLKIGAPAAVQIQYLGKPIDLSYFINNNQVAHLILDTKNR